MAKGIGMGSPDRRGAGPEVHIEDMDDAVNALREFDGGWPGDKSLGIDSILDDHHPVESLPDFGDSRIHERP